MNSPDAEIVSDDPSSDLFDSHVSLQTVGIC